MCVEDTLQGLIQSPKGSRGQDFHTAEGEKGPLIEIPPPPEPITECVFKISM